MRSLIDAALEDQTRRVLEGRPCDLPKCGASSIGSQQDRAWIRLFTEEERQAFGERKKRMLTVAAADHTISRDMLSERFQIHADTISRLLVAAGIKLDEPWWFGMREATAAGPQCDPYRANAPHRRTAESAHAARKAQP